MTGGPVLPALVRLLQPSRLANTCWFHVYTAMLISSALAGLVASAAGIQSNRFDMKEHPLDWGTLNATRGFCGMAKCYFPARLSEQEAGQAC